MLEQKLKVEEYNIKNQVLLRIDRIRTIIKRRLTANLTG